jgi:tetratricopeptide (TPR) repeat protein
VACFLKAELYEEAEGWLVGFADLIGRDGKVKTLVDLLNKVEGRIPLSPWLRIYSADLTLTSLRQGDAEKAREDLLLLSGSDDPKISSAALICLAKDRFKHNKCSESEFLLNQSMAIKSAMFPRDDIGIAFVLGELAHLRVNQGARCQEALELHERALSIQRQLGDVKGQAFSFRRIGSIHLNFLHDPSTALDMLGKAQECAEQAALKFFQVTIGMERAEALRRLSRYRDALAVLEKARAVARDCQDIAAEGRVLKRLGSLYEKAEHYGTAKTIYERCAAIYDVADIEEAKAVRRTIARVTRRIEQLNAELERVIADLDSPDVGAQPRKAKLLRRQAKRIRQRLNLEPALIRMGQ